ncbi:MAG: hypothetical protein ACKVTZ_18530 [Bacteroidia bacterium]
MKSIISFLLLFTVISSISLFAQKTKVARYHAVAYQKTKEAQGKLFASEELKDKVVQKPKLANEVYDVTAKVMAMNKFGKIQYLKQSTQCLVQGGVILATHKETIDNFIAAALNKDKEQFKKFYGELKAIDNEFVKLLVTSIGNQGDTQVQAASGSSIGGAIGTIIGGTVGLIAGGVAGGIGGAALGGTIGKAIGTLLDGLFGGGKGKGDDDDGDDTGGGGDDNDGGGNSGGGGSESKQAGGDKKGANWIKCPTMPTTCGAAPY